MIYSFVVIVDTDTKFEDKPRLQIQYKNETWGSLQKASAGNFEKEVSRNITKEYLNNFLDYIDTIEFRLNNPEPIESDGPVLPWQTRPDRKPAVWPDVKK